MRQSVQSGPSAWQQCEVCRAARTLQMATDALNTFRALGGVPERTNPLLTAVSKARKVWAHARTGRHTGAVHTPEIPA